MSARNGHVDAVRRAVPRASRRRRAPAARAAQRGIALVIVLWLTVLLTVVASGFAFSMRTEALAARNAVDVARARALADGAVERTLFELARPRVNDAWLADGAPRSFAVDEAQVRVIAIDEAAKIDLNTGTELLLKGLLKSSAGVDDPTADKLVDAIVDWRDPDDAKRPNGAEDADYRAAGLKYGPANAPFETVGELSRVLGMTPEIFAAVAPSLTVFSRQPGINPATASRAVLLALPAATPETVDAYLITREEARRAKLPTPSYPPATGFGAGAVPVWRIAAEATLPDGVTFVREAVLRPTVNPRNPTTILAWTQAPRLPAPPPEPGAAQAPTTTADARRP